MELVFLYIKNHNKFENQNLNFGSEYIFRYDVEWQNLDVEENARFIKNHYSKDKDKTKFVNVTSIIGQNGTGKTSILKYILDCFGEGMPLNKPVIFVTKSNNEFTIHITEDLIIKNDLSRFGFKTKIISINRQVLSGDGVMKSYSIDLGYDFRGLNNTELIFFSNIFDSSGGYFDLKGIYDISTNNLMWADYDREIKNKILTIFQSQNSLTSFENNEIHRQVKFIYKFFNSQKLPFEIPTELFIEVKNDYFKSSSNYNLPNGELYEYINIFVTRGNKTASHGENLTYKPKFLFILNIYLSFIVDFLLSYSFIDDKEIIGKLNNNEEEIITVEEIFENIKTVKSIFSHMLNNYEESYFENITKLLKLIDSTEQEDNLNFTFSNGRLLINISKNNFNAFENFMSLYNQSIIIRPFFNFKWRNMSSGERAFLNIFSRFYFVMDSVQPNDLKENLIIIIDEGDLYLHPQWQKRFVKELLDFLPVIFNEKAGKHRNLQLIFTTNSPIPASDLLSYNTIFLEKVMDNEGNEVTIVKDSLNEQKDTFGANIHTLLSDSFFVHDGLIGDFANTKINEVIENLLKRKVLPLEERDNMRKIIHQIGEPILKSKLLQMYNDRFNLEIHERLDNIEKYLGI